MTRLLFVTLLSLFTHVPEPQGARLASNTDAIVRAAEQAERELGVPPSVLLSVGWSESHLGTDPRSGGCWGAPISATRRNVAGTPLHAARVLARGHRLCGSDWRRSVAFFRSGACDGGRHGGYVERVSTLVRRLHARAGGAVPTGF